MVGEVLGDDHPHGVTDDARVDAVELQRARLLAGSWKATMRSVSAFRSTSARDVTISET